MGSAGAAFPELGFRGELRPSQAEVVEIAQRQLANGERRLHIVAPPGSGKTVLGLYLWAQCVRRPALVLSPNSAIQAQWAARVELFQGLDGSAVSTDAENPALLTSLTYQAVTLPGRGAGELDAQALAIWSDRLIDAEQAKDPAEAAVWLDDLARHNPDYYQQRLGFYRKQARDAQALGGEALQTLHQSARRTLERLREQQIGCVILDECHHLLGHWGRVLADAQQFLGQPVIIGLTATPPDRSGKKAEDLERYDRYFGTIDYEVPVPAVVKDGFLAPYQDLAYFVRPQREELRFIASADDDLHALLAELCQPQENFETLPDWLLRVLDGRLLPGGEAGDWLRFERRDKSFADAARWFLLSRQLALPPAVPEPVSELPVEEIPEMDILVPVIDRYVRHRLRRSQNEEDHRRAERVIQRLRVLGVQITDTGTQPCASPAGRVMAYSKSKTAALVPVLKAEMAVLQNTIRACVITDYEKTSATGGVENLLDDEAGGAIAAFKALLSDADTDRLDPVLLTGSSVLVDDDLAAKFKLAAEQWLGENGFAADLEFSAQAGFHCLNGRGADWCPRVYVEMITELFQRGLSRCLVGTRGLLGEGWDANKINVLIDLTTVTTSMTVNQLRGRSMRIDPERPDKVANNWDVVCIAPEFSKGLDDYKRFNAKHKTLFGVTDDGAIEKGVGHVHPAFTDLKPEGLEGSVSLLNEDMLARAAMRDQVRRLWRIGEPYRDRPIQALEVKPIDQSNGRKSGGFPPFSGAGQQWTGHSLALAVGNAILAALRETGQIEKPLPIHVGERAGGYVRVFLEDAGENENKLFTRALHEALGPLQRPKYVITRYVDRVTETFLSSLLPRIVGKYFQKRERERAMLHAVPAVLAQNKEIVAVYQRYWNRFVSPGEAVYAHHGSGEKLLHEAQQAGLTPAAQIHDKEIFL